MADLLNDQQRQGLRDFQAVSKGILTPADYFVAGIAFAARETMTLQEVWEAAGGNPGIKASLAEVIEALRQLDAVCDEAADGVMASPAFHYSFVCYSCRKEWEDTKPESDCPDPACGTTNSYSCKDAAPGVSACPAPDWIAEAERLVGAVRSTSFHNGFQHGAEAGDEEVNNARQESQRARDKLLAHLRTRGVTACPHADQCNEEGACANGCALREAERLGARIDTAVWRGEGETIGLYARTSGVAIPGEVREAAAGLGIPAAQLAADLAVVAGVVAPSITDEDLSRRFTRCAYPGPNPMYRCNACGAEEFGVRNLLVEHARTCGVRACGNCGGTGKRLGDPCVRCNGAGQDKHDPWCVGGEKDGICNCGADGVNPSRGGEQ